MIVPCSRCSGLFESKEGAEVCLRCSAFEQLLAVADKLVAWHNKVDVTSSTSAADELGQITDEAKLAANAARSL